MLGPLRQRSEEHRWGRRHTEWSRMVFGQMIPVETGPVGRFDQFETRLIQIAYRICTVINPVKHPEFNFF